MRNLGKADTRQLKLFACLFGKVIVYFKKKFTSANYNPAPKQLCSFTYHNTFFI